MATAGVLEILIKTTDETSSGLSKAENNVKKFGKGLSAKTVALGNIMSRVAEKAVVATGRFIKGSVQESMSFDKSMAQVAATLGKSTNEIQELSKFARKMGSETAFTAQQAAEGLNYMALAGYDAKKSMKMLPQVLNLAAAGNMDLARASDMVTDAESALGLETGQVEVLVDQMAMAASKSNTSVEQLGDAILTVGGTAKIMGKDTTQLTAALGLLADNGVKGSEGGTALRNILLSLTAPTDKASKALKKLGVEVFDDKGKMRSLEDIMLDMGSAMHGMTDDTRVGFINDIFNKRDLKSVEALLGTSKDRWEQLLDSIGNKSKGSAAQMAHTQLDNLAGDVTKFKSALGEAKLSIVEGLTPSLRHFTRTGTLFVQRLTKAFKKDGLIGALKEAHTMFKTLKQTTTQWAKQKLSDYFGLGEDASWGQIASKAFDKLKGKLKEKKIKIAELLNIPDAQDASWGDIAGNILDRLSKKLSKGGSFLQQIILGDEYKEGDAEGWKKTGAKISGWIGQAFEEGGLLSTLLGSAAERIKVAAEVASDLISGLASWIATHPDSMTSVITSIITSLSSAIPQLASAIGTLLGDEEIWKAVGQGMTNISYGLIEALFGKDAADAVRRFFGLDKEKKAGALFDENGNLTQAGKELGMNKQEAEAQIAYEKQYAQTRKELLEKAGLTDKQYTALDVFLAQYNSRTGNSNSVYSNERYTNAWQGLQKAFEGQEDKLQKYMDKLKENPEQMTIELLVEDEEGKAKIEALNEAAESVAGTYTLTFDIKTNGSIPAISPEHQSVLPDLRPDKEAKGNWNVPYDNFPALLHRGEMVLNKSQARQFRDGTGGGMAGLDGAVYSAVNKAMKKVNVMMSGEKVGDLTTKRINRNINASTYNKIRAMGG